MLKLELGSFNFSWLQVVVSHWTACCQWPLSEVSAWWSQTSFQLAKSETKTSKKKTQNYQNVSQCFNDGIKKEIDFDKSIHINNSVRGFSCQWQYYFCWDKCSSCCGGFTHLWWAILSDSVSRMGIKILDLARCLRWMMT